VKETNPLLIPGMLDATLLSLRSRNQHEPPVIHLILNLRNASTVAVVIAILAFATTSIAPCAEEVPAAEAVPVRQEISGGRFIYQVAEGDTSDSIAARFGEPALTLFSNGNEPATGSTIMIDNRHVAPAAVDQGVVINVPQRMLFVFRDGRVAGAWPITVGRPDWPTRSEATGSLRFH
jgi:hypothetical protein